MRVLIGSAVVGLDVVFDTVTRAITRDADDTDAIDWYVDGAPGVRIEKSLDDHAICAGRRLMLKPPKQFVEAYATLGVDPPWVDVLPKAVFKAFVKGITMQIDAAMGADTRYYEDVFVPVNRFLATLPPACVDLFRYKSLAGFGSVASFRPDGTGCALPVTYDRFGTRTGRLTVKSGPQILTLAKEHRDLLVSRYPGGQIVLLDYVSFEAQVALALAGRQPSPDVYADANVELFRGVADRDVVKRAVLGHLYGMGTAALQQTLGKTLPETAAIVQGLNRFFTGPTSLDDAVTHACRGTTVVNPFGRVVVLPDGNSRLALNTLVQSTAADAALSGFAALSRHIVDARIEAVPIFVIHDGLLIDCAPNALAQLETLAHVASVSTGLGGTFPVRIKQLCS